MSDRKYRRKAPIAIRVEAEELARIAARDREACGDPKHIRAVSLRVNTLENSESSSALFAQRTHCANGHPLSGNNLLPNKRGIRLCRICERARHAEWVRQSADAVTHSDRVEAQALMDHENILQIARGVAALRYMSHLNERGLLPDTALRTNAHLKDIGHDA